MRRQWWTGLPVLIIAFIVCGVGVARIWSTDDVDWSGALLAGAGLVTLGVWIGSEISHKD